MAPSADSQSGSSYNESEEDTLIIHSGSDQDAESQTELDSDAEGDEAVLVRAKEFPEEQEPSEKATKILEAYHNLSSRRVDLVGDYAGNELFLIEGDSLLLHCFSDSHLDFDHGFQLVHAVYLVEHLMHQLEQRKCNYHIAFFDNHKALCVPHRTLEENVPKYLFARAALIRHLQAHLHNSATRIKMFESTGCGDFQAYLTQTGLYFMMCHDGARPGQSEKKNRRSPKNRQDMQHVIFFRTMILSLIERGYNVALINGLEIRDTKVMTMVLERSRRTPHVELRSATATISTSRNKDLSRQVASRMTTLLEHHVFSERELLAAAAISEVLQQKGPDTSSDEELRRSAVLFLLHIVLLKRLAISNRRFDTRQLAPEHAQFLSRYAIAGSEILSTSDWHSLVQEHSVSCDISDAVDGRLFAVVASGLDQIPREVRKDLDRLCEAVSTLLGKPLTDQLTKSEPVNGSKAPTETEENDDISEMAVMPFSNEIFDKHLKSIRLAVDDTADREQSNAASRIFLELSHWHNAKKPVGNKGKPPPLTDWQIGRALRRNQFFMAEMQNYAASLTNAVGRSLEPETITVGAVRAPATKVSTTPASGKDVASNGKIVPDPKKKDTKEKKGGKLAAQNAAKEARMATIATGSAKKEEEDNLKITKAWELVCKEISREQDLASRYTKLKDYLLALPRTKVKVLDAEVQLCMLSALLEHWMNICRSADSKDPAVAALIWHTARSILASNGLTSTISKQVELTIKTLALPTLVLPQPVLDRQLAFKFALPTTAKHSLSVETDSKDFQLLHCGPYLERSVDSASDPRVDFEPDGWQRRVLDGIDSNKSLFVVAPTSAGKTFISFYAMRKVLEADDDSVLVYVAPTKALVNQIAAEIQARFSKKFKYGGKSVWAIHTRDYRINEPAGCQVLVTVPHVLQIMLLAPSNANSWSSRVKRIIFDEVHSIGNAEDGVVWEQLLLLAPCPIIALSATVGNPAEFSEWLSNTQAAIGNEVVTEGTTQRYSDLREFNYVPPQRFAFNGLGAKGGFGKLGLDGTPGFAFIHPIASLVNKSRGMPEDLSLEPRDCFVLYQSMVKHQTKEYPIPANLDPKMKTLPQLVGKKDVIPWERGLKDILKSWMADDKSPFDAVVAELGTTFHDVERRALQQVPGTSNTDIGGHSVKAGELLQTTLPLLCSLHEQDALPAILFNYDRGYCEKICQKVVQQLQDVEIAYKESSPKWKSKLEAWEKWKTAQEKSSSKSSKTAKASSKKMSKDDREDAEGDRTSRLDQQRDAGANETSEFDRFDPNAPLENFHFANHKRLAASELDEYVRQLEGRKVARWLIDALGRGIGVHHAGMNRKYRQVVEILFRKGFLRVIVATGTLALGINMPCKTVVFSGDSVFLTALNFRQGAGRAGRRGFDLLGNVVFQDISEAKVCRLLSSRLPDLNGHFPVTTTLVLRLFSLLHESKNSPYAVKAINSLLSQPRLYMGGPAFKDQTLHHLRFSIEYLRRQQLLDSRGATLNFAGLVSHLYYTENASFAFHALLKEGFFHRLCANIDKQEIATTETLMLVMAHLFGRVFCRQSDEEYKETVVKPSSSMVFLPPLPADASRVLREHAENTLQVFKTYVRTFVDQHVRQPDDTLPLTQVKIGAAANPETTAAQAGSPSNENNKASEEVADEWDADEADNDTSNTTTTNLTIPSLPATKIRSTFISLSGPTDTFHTISDLCRTTRSGVFLEESVIPHVGSYPDDLSSPLNAYLLDFYKHGDVVTLEKANRVRKGDVWFLLNDFSMVLATVIASLANFMKMTPGGDLDMLEVQGGLDVLEEAEDDVAAVAAGQEHEGPATGQVAGTVATAGKPVLNKKKAKNLDSWEEAAADDDNDDDAQKMKKPLNHAIHGRKNVAVVEDEEVRESIAAAEAAWEGEVGERGLLKVLKAFQVLSRNFNEKFRKMWA